MELHFYGTSSGAVSSQYHDDGDNNTSAWVIASRPSVKIDMMIAEVVIATLYNATTTMLAPNDAPLTPEVAPIPVVIVIPLGDPHTCMHQLKHFSSFNPPSFFELKTTIEAKQCLVRVKRMYA